MKLGSPVLKGDFELQDLQGIGLFGLPWMTFAKIGNRRLPINLHGAIEGVRSDHHLGSLHPEMIAE